MHRFVTSGYVYSDTQNNLKVELKINITSKYHESIFLRDILIYDKKTNSRPHCVKGKYDMLVSIKTISQYS